MIGEIREGMRVRFARDRVFRMAVVGSGLLAIVLLLFMRAMARELNHDEHQFIAPGALLLRAGLLPYRDYPLFHMPDLVFIFAAIFATTSHLLLAARCFNTLCAALLLLSVFAVAGRRFRVLQEARLMVAFGFVLLLSVNPFFRFTAGRAWNHDLPVLASVAGFVALLHAGKADRGWLWIGAGGALLGIAVGTRLSFAPLVAPFALVTLFFPARGLRRISCLTIFSFGLAVAMLPSALLFLSAPSQFLFGNFTYNGTIHSLYRQEIAPGELSSLRRLAFPLQQLLKSPSDLALAAGFVFFGLRPWWRAGWRKIADHREAVALVLLLPFLFLGSWAPAVSYRQYYYPFVPFLLLGNIYGIAREGRWQTRTTWLMAAVFFASLLEALPDLPYTRTILHPSEWPVITVHGKGAEIREFLPQGRVLTLAPIFPLEANLGIYKELATGPFAWRTAALVDKKTQTAVGLLDPDDLDHFLQSSPPDGILTGFEHHQFELPLVTYARNHGYLPRHLKDRGNLWLPKK